MRKLLQVPKLGLPRRQGAAALPRDAGGPVFAEPWQAHAFAIVMALYYDGHYSWAEWDDYLGHGIHSPGHFGPSGDDGAVTAEAAAARGDDDANDTSARANYSRWLAACEEDGAKFFDRWLVACERLLVARGIVTKDEFEDRILAFVRAEATAPRFAAGDRVVVRDIEMAGHTHLPLYVRGKGGVVERDRGLFVFPGAGDDDGQEKLQHVYTVRFDTEEVWGSDSPEHHILNFSLWDYHLDAA